MNQNLSRILGVTPPGEEPVPHARDCTVQVQGDHWFGK